MEKEILLSILSRMGIGVNSTSLIPSLAATRLNQVIGYDYTCEVIDTQQPEYSILVRKKNGTETLILRYIHNGKKVIRVEYA